MHKLSAANRPNINISCTKGEQHLFEKAWKEIFIPSSELFRITIHVCLTYRFLLLVLLDPARYVTEHDSGTSDGEAASSCPAIRATGGGPPSTGIPPIQPDVSTPTTAEFCSTELSSYAFIVISVHLVTEIIARHKLLSTCLALNDNATGWKGRLRRFWNSEKKRHLVAGSVCQNIPRALTHNWVHTVTLKPKMSNKP